MKSFYSNGKLLITGEYVVLDRAFAFALPTKFGQSLLVESNNSNSIHWKSYDSDGQLWFESQLDNNDVILNYFSGKSAIEASLIQILHQAYLLNPTFLNSGYNIITKLTFPRLWGLGTSSTLINNIATWLEINPYELLEKTFGGSGYDIACASHNTAILYQINGISPEINPINFSPDFSDKLYFVYLNQKQNSRNAIANYRSSKKEDIFKIVEKINQITNQIISDVSFSDFCLLLQEHESLMSTVLNETSAQERLFNDFKGVVKSLGAWGGDFVLVASDQNPTTYFKDKGYQTIIPYHEMIL